MSPGIDVGVPLREYTTPNIRLRLKPDTLNSMMECDKAKKAGALHYKALRNRCLALVRSDKESGAHKKGRTRTSLAALCRGKGEKQILRPAK